MKHTFTLLTVLLLAPLAALHSADTQRHNILFIFADDLGYGDMSCGNDHAISGVKRCDHNPGLKPFMHPDAAPDAPGHLHNIETDPGKTRNLCFEQSQIVEEMKTLLDQSKASGRSRAERSNSNP